ncbi:proline rich protein 5MeD [Purpureocillium lavendulum]|uniref:Proline rich protein 5MeD n=1 Tax=Purpureocillium lavendulum TaxID=1247861 RepID=A0AB34G480_9HYPO|nr:proline rich protein 5MeD [Purpureocillium lavendulum]
MLSQTLFVVALAACVSFAASQPTAVPNPDATASAEWFLCDLLGCATETTVTRTRWRTTTVVTTVTASQPSDVCSTVITSSTRTTTTAKTWTSPDTTAVPTSTSTLSLSTKTTRSSRATWTPITNSTTAPGTTTTTISQPPTVTSGSGTTTTLKSNITLSSTSSRTLTSFITVSPITNSTSSPGKTSSSFVTVSSITNSTNAPRTTKTTPTATTLTSNLTLSFTSSSSTRRPHSPVSSLSNSTTYVPTITTTASHISTVTTLSSNLTLSSTSSSKILRSSSPVSSFSNSTTYVPTSVTTTASLSSSTTVSSIIATTSEPVPSKLKPLECLTDGYLIQHKTLLRVNLRTGARHVVASGIGDDSSSKSGADVNALGYNPLDNYLYGARGQTLLRIGADGKTEPVLALPSPANLGDVDIYGQYYFSDAGASWGQVDLAPGSPRYGQLVAGGNATHDGLRRLADWAFSPADPRHAYSVAVDNKRVPALVRWSTETHRWETVHRYDGGGDSKLRATLFGAVMATSEGVVYASDNASGQIFRFPTKEPGAASKAGIGPRGSSSDGARCALAPDAGE